MRISQKRCKDARNFRGARKHCGLVPATGEGSHNRESRFNAYKAFKKLSLTSRGVLSSLSEVAGATR